jgi:hypothetical protein
MLKNITQTQWVAFVIGACSFLGSATAQLTTLFGANGAAYAASACAIVSGLAGVFLMATTGQSSVVQQVAAMPGVTRISVNEQASPALAAVATDPAQAKVGPVTADVRPTLVATAKAS